MRRAPRPPGPDHPEIPPAGGRRPTRRARRPHRRVLVGAALAVGVVAALIVAPAPPHDAVGLTVDSGGTGLAVVLGACAPVEGVTIGEPGGAGPPYWSVEAEAPVRTDTIPVGPVAPEGFRARGPGDLPRHGALVEVTVTTSDGLLRATVPLAFVAPERVTTGERIHPRGTFTREPCDPIG